MKTAYFCGMNTAKPFVKWAGGKSQLLNEIRRKYPERIVKYCEPFISQLSYLQDKYKSFSDEQRKSIVF